MTSRFLRPFFLCMALLFGASAHSASGEMGVGVPDFGMYSAATGGGVQTLVFGLTNATTPFPSGCARLVLSPGTMGMDTYKMAVATLLMSKATGKRIRFFAHAPRDDGCGVDYLQLMD